MLWLRPAGTRQPVCRALLAKFLTESRRLDSIARPACRWLFKSARFRRFDALLSFSPSRVSLLPRDRRRAGRFRQSARLDLDHRCGRLRASSVRDFPNSCAIQGQKTVMDHSSESASEAAETTLRKGRLSRFHFPKRLILARKARLTAGITRFYIAAYTGRRSGFADCRKLSAINFPTELQTFNRIKSSQIRATEGVKISRWAPDEF